jgi:uncharacterized membrane protein
MVSRLGRFLAYASLGWSVDACFTALHSVHRTGGPKRSSLWNLPVYGLAQPLFEPVHDALRGRASTPARGLAYGVGILGVEYVAGRLLRRALGEAPWDYSYARRNVSGLARPDFLPLWGLYGLALEPLHDALTGRAAPFPGGRRTSQARR